jgi:CRISPR/Cas system-associated protein Cas10 (large subunit of type III CRISPR-Cas system)
LSNSNNNNEVKSFNKISPTRLTCNFCGNIGHSFNECRKRISSNKCYTCGRTGHISRFCNKNSQFSHTMNRSQYPSRHIDPIPRNYYPIYQQFHQQLPNPINYSNAITYPNKQVSQAITNGNENYHNNGFTNQTFSNNRSGN